jgi:Cdc6-like AAA superfamily ATPase
MDWAISRGHHNIWQDFSLVVKGELILKTGFSYRLTGRNGSGKTSFIKKVLIPRLQSNPFLQYIFYVEQQVQSQFDAVKAHSAFKSPDFRMVTTDDMVLCQLKLLNEQYKKEPRPVIVILDEYEAPDFLTKWMRQITLSNICLLTVSHSDTSDDDMTGIFALEFKPITSSLSEVSSNESDY